MEWIDIKDRPPEDKTQPYLVCLNDGEIVLAYSIPVKDGSFFHSDLSTEMGPEAYVSFVEDIAYWMPLPSLPIEIWRKKNLKENN